MICKKTQIQLIRAHCDIMTNVCISKRNSDSFNCLLAGIGYKETRVYHTELYV